MSHRGPIAGHSELSHSDAEADGALTISAVPAELPAGANRSETEDADGGCALSNGRKSGGVGWAVSGGRGSCRVFVYFVAFLRERQR